MDSHLYEKLYHLAKQLHQQQTDIQQVLQNLLVQTGKLLDVKHGCLVTFLTPFSVDRVYVLGAEDETTVRNRNIWNDLLRYGLVGHVYNSDRRLTIRNIQSDPRWSTISQINFLPVTGSAAGIPLSIGGEVYGVLMLVHPTLDYFTQEKQTLLHEVASLASAALETADQLQRRTESLDYSTVFQKMLLPFLLTDEAGIITDGNEQACQYLGYTRQSIVGVPMQDVSDDRHLLKQLKSLGDDPLFFKSSAYNIDGEKTATLMRLRRVTVEGEQRVEWMLQDISALIAWEQQQRDLTAMVYHDLRQPLNNIVASNHALARLLADQDSKKIDKILRLNALSVQQLKQMADSLLDIQQLEEGNSLIKRTPVVMDDLVQDTVTLVRSNADKKGILIEKNLQPKLHPIELDRYMIRRVMVNLLDNAIKYSPNHTKVILTVTTNHDNLTVRVRDSGAGIPLEMQSRIFEKFQRIQRRNAPQGVGLGLAFCQLVVEAHGGSIWVESDGKSGSTFVFTLPLESQPDNEQPVSDDASDPAAARASA